MLKKSFKKYRNSFSGLSRPVWILALVMLINRSGTMVLPFMSLYLTSELGFTLESAGWVLSSFGVGSLVGTWIGGRLADKVGYLKVQFLSLLISGGFFIVLMFGETLLILCLLTFLTSATGDAFRPANMAAVGDLANEGTRTRSIALIRLAINLGFSIGPAIGGVIAHNIGFSSLFLIDGLTCIAAAFYLRWALREYRDRHAKNAAPKTEAAELLKVKFSPAFLWMTAGVLLWSLAFFQLFFSVPLFLEKDYSLSKDQIGLLMGAHGLLLVLIEMPVVQRFEKSILSYVIIFGSFLCAIAFAVFLLPAFNVWILSLGFILFITIGELFYLPFTASLALDLAPDHLRGRYMGLYGMSFSLAHIAAPIVGMQVAEAVGFKTLWGICTGLLVVVALLTWRTRKLRVEAGKG
jgi:predicted MFS family arabinose efflux permease